MSFVIYNPETTYILRIVARHLGAGMRKEVYATERAAKAALTRYHAKHPEDNVDYKISDSATFHQFIEKRVVKNNLIGGGEFEQALNTPLCLDPSSETYHSM